MKKKEKITALSPKKGIYCQRKAQGGTTSGKHIE
jgi:hypothetical protein